ncbi:MAG TPA: hypothetical protein VMW92_07470 [Candidatus Heimdallarchaeota archaeon]|nr:hypothetical protein [Candidatus Heimdallarchaeota archaeon]
MGKMTWEIGFGNIGGFMGCRRRSWQIYWRSIKQRWRRGKEKNISRQDGS